MIATGSGPRIPRSRLADAGYWTNREATTLREIPDSVIVLGGGPSRDRARADDAALRCRGPPVEGADRLLEREDPRVGELVLDGVARGRDRGPSRRGDTEVGAVRGEGENRSRRQRRAGPAREVAGRHRQDAQVGGSRARDCRNRSRARAGSRSTSAAAQRSTCGHRRRHRRDAVHPRREISGPDRVRRHHRRVGASRLPGHPPRRVLRSRGRRGRDRRGTGS